MKRKIKEHFMSEKEKTLEDFGEHIKGAKKETYFKAIDPTHEEVKSLPLSKLWKDKDIKAIEDRTLRAIAFAIKDPKFIGKFYELFGV